MPWACVCEFLIKFLENVSDFYFKKKFKNLFKYKLYNLIIGKNKIFLAQICS